MEKLSDFIRRNPAAFAIAAFVLVMLCLSGGDPSAISLRLGHEALAAVVCGLFLFLGQKAFGKGAKNSPMALPVIYVAAVGLFVGVLTFQIGTDFKALGLHVLLCVLTAFTEEALFRRILLGAFLECTKGKTLGCAVLCALVFGVVHVSDGFSLLAGGWSLLLFAQMAAKAFEAFLFALVMTGIVVKSGSLIPAVIAHALFNLFSQGGVVLASGLEAASYVTGDARDLVIVCLAAVVLIPGAVISLKELARP